MSGWTKQGFVRILSPGNRGPGTFCFNRRNLRPVSACAIEPASDQLSAECEVPVSGICESGTWALVQPRGAESDFAYDCAAHGLIDSDEGGRDFGRKSGGSSRCVGCPGRPSLHRCRTQLGVARWRCTHGAAAVMRGVAILCGQGTLGDGVGSSSEARIGQPRPRIRCVSREWTAHSRSVADDGRTVIAHDTNCSHIYSPTSTTPAKRTQPRIAESQALIGLGANSRISTRLSAREHYTITQITQPSEGTGCCHVTR